MRGAPPKIRSISKDQSCSFETDLEERSYPFRTGRTGHGGPVVSLSDFLRVDLQHLCQERVQRMIVNSEAGHAFSRQSSLVASH